MQVFVSNCLSYLTCGRGGLTDIEMDDVLSCDDDVINQVYKYHDPPLPGTIRIPGLLWARLQYVSKTTEVILKVLAKSHVFSSGKI